MKKTITKKMTSQGMKGYSKYIIIPKEWLKKMKIKEEVVLSFDGKKIVISGGM